MRRGLRAALVKALRDYGERAQNKKVGLVTADDVMASLAGLLSVFVRNPEFQGQTKERLSSAEAAAPGRDHDQATISTTGSPMRRSRRRRLLDFLVERAEERLRRKQEKDVARKTRDAQAAPAGQARRLHASRGRGRRDLHRRRR